MSLSDDQIHQFARHKAHEIWAKAKADEVTVKRETEGANGVWWITWKKKEDDIRVLIFPRDESEYFSERRRAAAVRFLVKYLVIQDATDGQFRFPRKADFDLGKRNPLGFTYFIREKEDNPPWYCLRDDFREYYTQHDRCEIAVLLGLFYRGILESKVTSKDAGRLIYDQDKYGNQASGPQPFHDNAPSPAECGSSAYDLIAANLRFLKSETAADKPELSELYDELLGMAESLKRQGWLSGEGFCFVDPKLVPGTIGTHRGDVPNLIDLMQMHISPSPNVVVVPDFVAAMPPYWLWNPEKLNHGSWLYFNEIGDFNKKTLEPANEDLKQLKIKFENAAGEEYKRLAHAEEYKIARQLVWRALGDYPALRDRVVLELLVIQWKEFNKKKEQGPAAQKSALQEQNETWERIVMRWGSRKNVAYVALNGQTVGTGCGQVQLQGYRL
ncbi:hypothetical protein GE09DRAFT_1215158 [Coniochaeta sp. 2T2.1]|nr:hypothetical protein GE09DRAFT_1215158 [Coniochaeta sp. 2T2.1]